MFFFPPVAESSVLFAVFVLHQTLSVCASENANKRNNHRSHRDRVVPCLPSQSSSPPPQLDGNSRWGEISVAIEKGLAPRSPEHIYSDTSTSAVSRRVLLQHGISQPRSKCACVSRVCTPRVETLGCRRDRLRQLLAIFSILIFFLFQFFEPPKTMNFTNIFVALLNDNLPKIIFNWKVAFACWGEKQVC